MLAVLSNLPTNPAGFGFEFKWDGVRAVSYVNRKSLRIESRNQLDITATYPELASLAEMLKGKFAVLDGEIVALDEHGSPSFPRLQHRMHVLDVSDALVREYPVQYFLFDVLYWKNCNVMRRPYRERRAMLDELIAPLVKAPFAVPPWEDGHDAGGQNMLDTARRHRLEGLVAKELASPYEPGRRSPAWRKIKIIARQELVVGGWVPEAWTRTDRVGALLLGYYEGQKFRYAGRVGTGFNAATHASLTSQLAKTPAKHSPFWDRVPSAGVLWTQPSLVAEVEYRRWPKGGLIQQAAYKGQRKDKPPKTIVKETPE